MASDPCRRSWPSAGAGLSVCACVCGGVCARWAAGEGRQRGTAGAGAPSLIHPRAAACPATPVRLPRAPMKSEAALQSQPKAGTFRALLFTECELCFIT